VYRFIKKEVAISFLINNSNRKDNDGGRTWVLTWALVHVSCVSKVLLLNVVFYSANLLFLDIFVFACHKKNLFVFFTC